VESQKLFGLLKCSCCFLSRESRRLLSDLFVYAPPQPIFDTCFKVVWAARRKALQQQFCFCFFYFKMFLSHIVASGPPLCVVVFYHQWPWAHSSMIMPISITPGLCDNQEASCSFGCVRICDSVAVWGFTDSHGRWQPAGWSDLSWWYQTCSMFTSCNPDLQSDPITFIPAVQTVWELLFNELK